MIDLVSIQCGSICTHLGAARFGLYTILASPISYGVWHAQGGSEEASYIAQETWTSIAIVRAMQVGGAYKRMIDSCTQASK